MTLDTPQNFHVYTHAHTHTTDSTTWLIQTGWKWQKIGNTFTGWIGIECGLHPLYYERSWRDIHTIQWMLELFPHTANHNVMTALEWRCLIQIQIQIQILYHYNTLITQGAIGTRNHEMTVALSRGNMHPQCRLKPWVYISHIGFTVLCCQLVGGWKSCRCSDRDASSSSGQRPEHHCRNIGRISSTFKLVPEICESYMFQPAEKPPLHYTNHISKQMVKGEPIYAHTFTTWLARFTTHSHVYRWVNITETWHSHQHDYTIAHHKNYNSLHQT